MKQTCILSVPVDLSPENEDWEFSKIDCDFSGLYEYVENSTTSANFYLEKSFTYGDFFIMGFLTIFFLIGITKIIWQTFVKK